MKYSIVIPYYNEGNNIKSILSRFQNLLTSYQLELIIVENGSTDNSKKYLSQYLSNKKNIKVVYVKQNKGYGFGLQAGLKVARGDYVGWIHADMQVEPSVLIKYFEFINLANKQNKFFLKGIRVNRSFVDYFFTHGQSFFNSLLFGRLIYDVGAIPVLFHKSLIYNLNSLPNDFSIELAIYYRGIKNKFVFKRFSISLQKRAFGKSSWDNGLGSKIKQSLKIFTNSFKIRFGVKVK
jgi:glycosyltransferase involved in cell wall biosynthesis